MLHNCQADIRPLIPRNAPRQERLRYPNEHPKLLVWGRRDNLTDLVENQNIQGHSSQMLHIVFSDSEFAGVLIGGDAQTRYACISTLARLSIDSTRWSQPSPIPRSGRNLTVPDSFTNGEFEVEVHITSDEGTHKKFRLLVIVDTNWENLDLRFISRVGRVRRFISHVYNRLPGRRVSNPTLNH